MTHVFFVGVIIDILGFVMFGGISFVTPVSKTASLSHVSNKVLREKWPYAFACGHIMFLSKPFVYHCICNQNLDFQAPPLLCLLSNEFILSVVCFQCVQYIESRCCPPESPPTVIEVIPICFDLLYLNIISYNFNLIGCTLITNP